MRKLIGIALVLLLAALFVGAAPDEGRYWQNHAQPFTFLFGNHLDTHQETRLQQRGNEAGELRGWLYVFDSGQTLADGTPVLRHCTTEAHYEAGCVAGWEVKAKPCIDEVNGCRATFLYHDDDHPVWLIGARVDGQGGLRGTRSMLAQPGSYTHFHWLTDNVEMFHSSLTKIEKLFDVDIAVPDECNVAMASQLEAGATCPGYYLQLTAGQPFGLETWAFHHGGEDLVLEADIDNMTHLNLLTSYRSLQPGLLPGSYADGDGGGGGSDDGGGEH